MFDKSPVEAAAERLGRLLDERSSKMTTAESCTAGGVANVITSVPGSSSWFEYGFVTYSNQAKIDLLGVSEAQINLHGAVSEETVTAMLLGALSTSKAQVGISVSGIAGPSGGSVGKPVGTVCFAWGGGQDIQCCTQHIPGNRKTVREEAVSFAIQSLIEYLRN